MKKKAKQPTIKLAKPSNANLAALEPKERDSRLLAVGAAQDLR